VFSAALNAGTNSISFGHGSGYAELDELEVYSPSTRYEAESATLVDAWVVGGSLRLSSSGGAQVGYINNSDSTVTFTGITAATAGTYVIRVRYSNGSGSTSSHAVSVNGGTSSSLNYPATANWGTDADVTFNATLAAGSNTISFTHQTGFAELDCIDVYQNQ